MSENKNVNQLTLSAEKLGNKKVKRSRIVDSAPGKTVEDTPEE